MQLRPHGLGVVLQVRHHRARLGGGRRHVKAALADTRGGAVIENEAVLAQHETVAATSHLEIRPAVDVDALQKLRGIAALDGDLAQGRHIHHAHRVAYRQGLAVDGVHHSFAGLGVVLGAQPQSRGDEISARLRMPIVHGAQTQRCQIGAHFPGRHGAQGHRGERWSEGGGADLGNVRALQAREDCQADDVAGAPLIGAHAEGGVTFQMLHRVITLALRESEILGGNIVLQIDETFAAPSPGERHRPQCFHRRLGDVVTTPGAGTVKRREARQARRLRPGRLTFAQAIAQRKAAPGGAH